MTSTRDLTNHNEQARIRVTLSEAANAPKKSQATSHSTRPLGRISRLHDRHAARFIKPETEHAASGVVHQTRVAGSAATLEASIPSTFRGFETKYPPNMHDVGRSTL